MHVSWPGHPRYLKKKKKGLEAKKINFLSSNILVGINSSEQVNCQTYFFYILRYMYLEMKRFIRIFLYY